MERAKFAMTAGEEGFGKIIFSVGVVARGGGGGGGGAGAGVFTLRRTHYSGSLGGLLTAANVRRLTA